MREEYDFSNAPKNPYAKELKKQVTIKISPQVMDYFKKQANKMKMPYQTLINLYLLNCVNNKKEPQITWKTGDSKEIGA